MNRTIIATVTIIVVAAVAIFGVREYTQATAANPVTPDDADINWDGRINSADQLWLAKMYFQPVSTTGRPVREQNLDANGNIKVAQQGPIDVSVIAQPQTGPNLEELASFPSGTVNYCFSGCPPYETPFFDVQGCIRFQIHIKGVSPLQPSALHFGVIGSADGITGDFLLGGSSGFGFDQLGGSWMTQFSIPTNHASVRLSPGATTTTTFSSLKVFCERNF